MFFGAVLRGDVDSISIGARSNIQDNVSVHCDSGIPTTVGAGVSVGHSAVLHGCTVEDDCLIGMSATVLNHAVIGAGSLVAAGSVVLEGTDRSAELPGGRGAGQGAARTHRGRARETAVERGALRASSAAPTAHPDAASVLRTVIIQDLV